MLHADIGCLNPQVEATNFGFKNNLLYQGFCNFSSEIIFKK